MELTELEYQPTRCIQMLPNVWTESADVNHICSIHILKGGGIQWQIQDLLNGREGSITGAYA